MKKQHNNLNDIELNIIREYKSWKKSECVVAYKHAMLSQWRERAKTAKIEHLL